MREEGILRKPQMINKNNLYSLLLLLIGTYTLSSSCKQQETIPKKYYNLRIFVDTANTFHLDSIYISSPFKRDPRLTGYNNTNYDSLHLGIGYLFDSTESGPLTIMFQSMADTLAEKKLNLDRDTTIFIKGSELPSFQKAAPENLDLVNIHPGETLCISIQSSGCFHHYKEKMLIQRQSSGFHAEFYSTRNMPDEDPPSNRSLMLKTSFGDSLLSFQNSLIRFVREYSFGGCTTSSSYLIQKGDSVWIIYDDTCSNLIRYYALLQWIKPEWFLTQEGN